MRVWLNHGLADISDWKDVVTLWSAKALGFRWSYVLVV